MSYILDALKKSQAEAAEGVSLRMGEDERKRSLTPWLVGGVSVLLLGNLGLLMWIFVLEPASTPASPDAPPETASVAPASAEAAPDTRTPPARQPEISTPEPVAARRPAAQTAEADGFGAEPGAGTGAAPAPAAAVQRYALADLPAAEQVLYNGFNYSTHIYTDDPSLCAIVVDGQRLTAGDAFKGLRVVAVTEKGVVFEERRAGRAREVEVSVLQQWED